MAVRAGVGSEGRGSVAEKRKREYVCQLWLLGATDDETQGMDCDGRHDTMTE